MQEVAKGDNIRTIRVSQQGIEMCRKERNLDWDECE